jgi:hypothetical protein
MICITSDMQARDELRRAVAAKNAALVQLTTLQYKFGELIKEVRLTIVENRHLADGDDCTLARLKKALAAATQWRIKP